MKLRAAFVVLFVWACLKGHSQNYHAIHGTSNAASLNVSNNPASIVNTPFSWDVTLFAFQLKSASNAFTIHNYSLISSPAKSQYGLNEGQYARKADLNFNINLLNARIALNRQSAIAFGANMRGYTRIRTKPYNYADTIQNITDFLKINDPGKELQAKIMNSSWLELYATYSRTLWDNEQTRLNGGITLKVNRGIAGVHGEAQDIRATQNIQPASIKYYPQSGSVAYGYSSNFDRWQSDQSTSQNINELINYTQGGLSLDMGAELLIKTQAVRAFSDADDGYYEYEWKIGVSLLDLGKSQYKYGNKSRRASNPRTDISSEEIQNKFNFIEDFEAFNDSLATVVNSFSGLHGQYAIIHPARMVVNVDRYIINDFYLNGELSLNLSTLAGNKKMHVQELNLLTVTPRWETRRWGAYMPIQLNNLGKFWVGGAVKAGPVLLGIHNFANIFTKNQMQNGGGYLAIIVHSWKKNGEKRYKKVDCFP